MITPSETDMTLFDFLAQAGFWQWVGLIFLAIVVGSTIAAACKGLGNLRFRGDINKYYDKTKP